MHIVLVILSPIITEVVRDLLRRRRLGSVFCCLMRPLRLNISESASRTVYCDVKANWERNFYDTR